jgi:ABC-type Fe3+ transport system substrate-binding protein
LNNNWDKKTEKEMSIRMTSVSLLAVTAAIAAWALPSGASAQGIKSTYDEIVAAAKEEPPVQWCTGLGPDESQPIVEAFAKAFPGVPEPNDFECFGEEATQRVVAEWTAGAPQVDVLDMDTEILETLDKNNLSLVFDWSVFDGTPVEVSERHRLYDGRIVSVGSGFRVIWYNPSIVSYEDAPKSYEECADPRYKGMLAQDVRPPFFDMMEEIGGPWSDDELREWAKGIAANEPLWIRGTSQAFQVISAGERGIVCGQQLHGLFRGDRTNPDDPDAVAKYIIPKQVIVYDYLRLGFAPEPLAPNATVLFAAWMGSDAGGQTEIAAKNPGYSSPHIKGSFTQTAIEKAGAEILQASQEQTSSVAARMNEIILTEWGFPSPAK